ncbi:unnamed protein product [Vitrella brassicaformis CCMP3155]|uniref:DNA-directed DNA polymerase family A palm domain-containing protein n=3 Tax=Vitrella brassicaformis TaxID=1169539 RepID=A0A0G4GWY4_VITBC|nr:unnamed protein product [Vitrella brassicaformis CCMP3155]|eukprot:CEM35360.1 unnamed protein product [Vitrella brassicaformis CCMP3155]
MELNEFEAAGGGGGGYVTTRWMFKGLQPPDPMEFWESERTNRILRWDAILGQSNFAAYQRNQQQQLQQQQARVRPPAPFQPSSHAQPARPAAVAPFAAPAQRALRGPSPSPPPVGNRPLPPRPPPRNPNARPPPRPPISRPLANAPHQRPPFAAAGGQQRPAPKAAAAAAAKVPAAKAPAAKAPGGQLIQRTLFGGTAAVVPKAKAKGGAKRAGGGGGGGDGGSRAKRGRVRDQFEWTVAFEKLVDVVSALADWCCVSSPDALKEMQRAVFGETDGEPPSVAIATMSVVMLYEDGTTSVRPNLEIRKDSKTIADGFPLPVAVLLSVTGDGTTLRSSLPLSPLNSPVDRDGQGRFFILMPCMAQAAECMGRWSSNGRQWQNLTRRLTDDVWGLLSDFFGGRLAPRSSDDGSMSTLVVCGLQEAYRSLYQKLPTFGSGLDFGSINKLDPTIMAFMLDPDDGKTWQGIDTLRQTFLNTQDCEQSLQTQLSNAEDLAVHLGGSRSSPIDTAGAGRGRGRGRGQGGAPVLPFSLNQQQQGRGRGGGRGLSALMQQAAAQPHLDMKEWAYAAMDAVLSECLSVAIRAEWTRMFQRDIERRFCTQDDQQMFLDAFIQQETPTAVLLAELDVTGICCESEFFTSLHDSVESAIDDIREKARQAAGKTFNLASPQQVAEVLYDDMKVSYPDNLSVERKKKTDQRSTDQEALSRILRESRDPNVRAVVQMILHHRSLSGFMSKEIKSIPQYTLDLDEGAEMGSGRRWHESSKPRCFSKWNQMQTGTGRLSCATLNMQNIPKPQVLEGIGEVRARDGFKTAQPDTHVLVSVDYAQIEMRIFAHFCGDGGLQQILNQSDSGWRGPNDVDIYTEMAARHYRRASSAVSKEQRNKFKRAYLSLIYGTGNEALAKQIDATVAEAQTLKQQFLRQFPEAKTFMDRTQHNAQIRGFVTTITGRRRRVGGGAGGRDVHTKAVNAVIQGSAADLLKIAMLAVRENLAKRTWKNHPHPSLLLTIHDELVFECGNDDVKQLCRLLRESMCETPADQLDLAVPLMLTAKKGISWGSMEAFDPLTLPAPDNDNNDADSASQATIPLDQDNDQQPHNNIHPSPAPQPPPAANPAPQHDSDSPDMDVDPSPQEREHGDMQIDQEGGTDQQAEMPGAPEEAHPAMEGEEAFGEELGGDAAAGGSGGGIGADGGADDMDADVDPFLRGQDWVL